MRNLLLGSFLALGIVACSSTSLHPISQVGLMYVTNEYVERNPEKVPSILTVTQATREFLNGDVPSFGHLQTFVTTFVDIDNLDPVDQLMLGEVLRLVEVELLRYLPVNSFGDPLLTDEARSYLLQVLDNIDAIARLYAPTPGN